MQLLFIVPPLSTAVSKSSQARRTVPICRRASWQDVVNNQPPKELRKHSLAVPRHLWNPRMRQRGVYRSVEYVIEKLTLDGQEVFTTASVPPSRVHEVVATVRPLNRLLPRFERAWPVEVAVGDAVLWTYKRDLIRCALVTLAMSVTFVTIGLIGPTVLGIYSIPTVSMEPSLYVGDALLVEKISLRATPPRKGEIVLFTPPSRLKSILTSSNQHLASTRIPHRNDLFIKRVVAVPGDVIEVRLTGVFVNAVKIDEVVPNSPIVAPCTIPDGYIFVIGDNPSKSLDSRYWGLLPIECVVGRPVARIFPPQRLHVPV
ncbi:putative signal peptidase I-2 [Gracilariopsis chorda]|uniref:Mitochondrial inner membrane protease subunit n=1 Tax=Gracilariopsis chorda TaxID=448386 RepID=A0A2V3ILR8_9FLOR|nr:putative signal peptidase I-2 [Gracilariopsis chorda]|eukprot:PXF43031.1 putative signal peptidase I-2 [Gracilariopsis chorda]